MTTIALHGLEAVLVAVELALQSGRVSGEHVLNVLARLKEPVPAADGVVNTPLILNDPPQADVLRYDQLRLNKEASHVQ